jgi:hypothetical protein
MAKLTLLKRTLGYAGLLAATASLIACGGGGSSSSSVAPTSSTASSAAESSPANPAAAPVANTSASNQLAGSVAIGGYTSLSVAQLATPTSSSSTRTAFNRVFQNLASLFVKNSVAQATTACSSSSDVMKLVGIGSDGSLTPIAVTLGTDACGVGFLDMFDAKNYVLLVGEGIYKDDLTCNLVFVKKADGQMFCVGETQSARYKIKGSKSWGNYQILQVSEDGNFLFLEASAQTFKNNIQTGELTKLLRFDLTDLNAGPQAKTIYEGFNTNWMSTMYGSSNASTEQEGFAIQGYVGLDNGNLAIQFYRNFSNGSSWFSVNRAQYVSFDSAGNPVKSNIDFSGGFGSNNWPSISCWLKTSANPSKAYLVTNASYSYGGYMAGGGTGYGIFSIDAPSSGATTVMPNVVVQRTALCSNSWSANTITRRGNTYYSVTNSYNYNGSSFGSGTSTYLVSNDLTGGPDTQIALSFNSNGWGWSNSKITTSKDYLYVTLPQTSYSWWDNSGDSVIQVNPLGGSVSTAINSSSSYLVSSVSASLIDNAVKVSGRIKSSDDLAKFVGTITGATTPVFTLDTTNSTGYKPITVVKL